MDNLKIARLNQFAEEATKNVNLKTEFINSVLDLAETDDLLYGLVEEWIGASDSESRELIEDEMLQELQIKRVG